MALLNGESHNAPRFSHHNMSSLFDIAADLTQYDSASQLPRTSSASNQDAIDRNSSNTTFSVLSILDETLQTIYDAGSRSSKSTQPQTSAGFSSRQLKPSASQVDLDNRLQTLKQTKPKEPQRENSTASAPQQLKIPPPPPLPPSTSSNVTQKPPSIDPDLSARDALRQLNEEIEQLGLSNKSCTTEQRERWQRALTEKYLVQRLNNLAPTPFVSLVRRKSQQKIDQLGFEVATQAQTTSSLHVTGTLLPSQQHEMLQKLLRVPESHLAKLTQSQRDMIQFAKRYDQICRLTPAELQKLPVSQQQLVQQLQKQMSTKQPKD